MDQRCDLNGRPQGWATAGGFAAILLWSATIALARSLSEQLGPVTAAAAVYSVAGAASLARLAASAKSRRQLLCLPRRYLLGCGALFSGYMLCLYLAVGLATDRRQVLEIGLLNYLWPALTLLLTVAILRRAAGWLLLPGTLLALSGLGLVLTQGEGLSWAALLAHVQTRPAAYALALAAAFAWALYSVLARKWAGGSPSGGVDLFLPVTAALLLLICAAVEEPRDWGARPVAEALALGLATWAAYLLWDSAMRTGNLVLVAAGSYLTPLISTLASCLYLAVVPQTGLWLGCVMLVAGSLASWYAVSGGSSRR